MGDRISMKISVDSLSDEAPWRFSWGDSNEYEFTSGMNIVQFLMFNVYVKYSSIMR